MTHRDPRQQHLEFLQKSLAQVETELNEAELLVLTLRENRAYFREEIARIAPIAQNFVSLENFSEETFSFNEHKAAFKPIAPNGSLSGGDATSTLIDEDEDLEDGDFEEGEDYENFGEEDRRNPKEMLRAEYKVEARTFGEAIEIAFKRLGNRRLSADAIAQSLFDRSSLSEDDYFRARNSLSTELRRGATDKGGSRWKKVGRGMFMSNLAYEQYQSRQQELASVNGLKSGQHYINNAENLDS